MYLITKDNLNIGQVRKLRGDSSETAVQEYIHINSDIIEAYKASSYRFIQSVLEEVNTRGQE